jgi:hypothetical protein
MQKAPYFVLLHNSEIIVDEMGTGRTPLRYCWRIRLSKGRSIFLKHPSWLIFPTEERNMTFLVISFPTF